ncbi:MAG: hypothetical protein ACI9F9_001242 [Candidatus Paceibacteria bacterium]|jgi:hypothetical protein
MICPQLRATALVVSVMCCSTPIALAKGPQFPTAPTGWDSAEAFLLPYGLSNFSPFYKQALRTWLDGRQAHLRFDEPGAQQILDSLWQSHPTGGPGWGNLPTKPFGINIGSPPCYYGLRMLSDTVDWRVQSGVQGMTAPRSVRFTVVMVGQSHGIEPRNLAELNAGTGIPVVHTIDSSLRNHDFRIVRESLDLFEEYVFAMTDGNLSVDTQMLWLPSADLAVRAYISQGRYIAAPENAADVWGMLSESVKSETDWWWLIYPSHVPEQYPDFQNSEFVTGGMGTGIQGTSPLFLIDDRWLVRKPPHIGTGKYSVVERRAYLPQWLQHEFFHHLFRTYPEFGLEDTPHQWFDLSTWPPDFVGRYEADYFHEAMFKRLMTASPPLHVALRYSTEDAPWDQLTYADVTGTYHRIPVENNWHVGTISQISGNVMKWKNNANVQWSLDAQLLEGRLYTGPDCPYYNPPDGTKFDIALKRNAIGDLTSEVIGFYFSGELYTKQ